MFAVQIREPSNAIPVGKLPISFETSVAAPGGCVGSIISSCDSPGRAVKKTRLIATRTPTAAPLPALVQVPRSLPSLARTRDATVCGKPACATQRSAPSYATFWGLSEIGIENVASTFCVVHHRPSAARREDRAIAWLTPFETKTAACPRVTGLSGENVVGEVPTVMPR